METRDVLIVNSRKPVPEQVLGSDLLGHVTVVTEPAFAGWFDDRVDLRLVPRIDDVTAVKDVVAGVLAERGLDAVLSPAEHGISTAGYLRSYFGLPGTGFDTAAGFSNKLAMKMVLRRHGVPVAPFRPLYRLDDLVATADAVGWPVVVKAAFGTGCVNVRRLDSPAEARRFLAGAEARRLREMACPFVVERHLDIRAEYHSDAVVHDGDLRLAVSAEYVIPPLLIERSDEVAGTYTLPAGHPADREITALHRRVVAALGLRAGVTHLEVLDTPEGHLVGEITCRPGGAGITDAVRLVTGVDLWGAYLRTELGLAPDLGDRAGEPAPGILLTAHLKAQAGTIVAQTPERELAALPDAVATRMVHRVGDTVDYRLYSSAANGFVFFRLADESAVPARLRAVGDCYRCEVRPLPGG